MAREVAARWVEESSAREYRFTISGFNSIVDTRRAAHLLRSWRDGKNRVASLGAPDPSAGLAERGEYLELWSSDVDSMRRVARWAEAAGLDTTFIW